MKPKRKTIQLKTGAIYVKPKGFSKVVKRGRNWLFEYWDFERRKLLLRPVAAPKPRPKLIGIKSTNRPSKRQRAHHRSIKTRNHFDAIGGGKHYLGERGKGGVMKPFTTILPGQRTTTTWSTGGSPPKTTVVTTVASLNGFLKDLSGVLSVKGDHKTPNPHRFTVLRYNYGNGQVSTGDYRAGSVIVGTQAVVLGLTGAWGDAKALCYNKALSRLYDNLRSDVDLSVDIAEHHQASRMVSQRFKQAKGILDKKVPLAGVAIWKILSQMKRSNPRDWGNLWLEFTYGWRPLAHSVFGGLENAILASSPNAGATGHKLRVSAKEVHTDKKTVTTAGGYTTGRVLYGTNKCRINAFYAMATGGLNSVANFTSLNPVSIAWEVVPYSFVVDWFFNVGGYLRNLESSLLFGSDFVGGYTTELFFGKETVTQSGSNGSTLVQGTSSQEKRSFARAVLGSSPSPRHPGFNTHLGWQRLISGASLLGQMLHSLEHGKKGPKGLWDAENFPFNQKWKGGRNL